MRANRRQQNGGYTRMNHGAASRHRVSGTPGGSRDDKTVALYDCDQDVVAVHFEKREEGRGASIDDDLVENMHVTQCPNERKSAKSCNARAEGKLCRCVEVKTNAFVVPRLASLRGHLRGERARSSQRAMQTHANRDLTSATKCTTYCLCIILNWKVCKETQRSKVEANDWRHDCLEQGRGIEDGAVAAQADDQIGGKEPRVQGICDPRNDGSTGHKLFRVGSLKFANGIAFDTQCDGREVGAKVFDNLEKIPDYIWLSLLEKQKHCLNGLVPGQASVRHGFGGLVYIIQAVDKIRSRARALP
eukprot:m.324482 g.324482  ORF g.324482 m.324482 type:complete len:303 (+) comp55539_c0_seq7:484-1392(+)